MKKDLLNRRMFLQGVGGMTFAIPFLPSLFSPMALAQTSGSRKPRFIAIHHNYGTFAQNIFPTTTSGLTPIISDDTKLVKAYRLSECLSHTPLFSGLPSFLSVADKMLLIQGIDKLGYVNHKSETMLCGSYNGRGDYAESIDQIMIRSGKVYDPSSPPFLVSMHLGSNQSRNRLSWKKQGNEVLPVVQHENAASAIEFVWMSMGSTPAINAKKKAYELSIIDFAKEDYQQLLRNPRLSGEDKRRLVRHLDLIREFEKRVDSRPSVSCARPDAFELTEATFRNPGAYVRDVLFVMESLITCNLTNIITFSIHSNHLHGISHGNAGKSSSPAAIMSNLDRTREIAQEIGNFLQAIDIAENATSTYLDNSIVYWGSDMGSDKNHVPLGIPQILAGGKGILETGRYMDYRSPVEARFERGRPGRPVNELQITLMRAMGLSPSDWEVEGKEGFGSYKYSGYDSEHYGNDKVLNDRRSALPYLLKA